MRDGGGEVVCGAARLTLGIIFVRVNVATRARFDHGLSVGVMAQTSQRLTSNSTSATCGVSSSLRVQRDAWSLQTPKSNSPSTRFCSCIFICWVFFNKMINDEPLSCSKTNSFGVSEQRAELVRRPLRSACMFSQAEPTPELSAGSNPFNLQSSSGECDVT